MGLWRDAPVSDATKQAVELRMLI